MEKIMSSKKKIIVIVILALFSISAVAGIGVGIYFGVNTVACSGVVLESGTNTPIANVSVTDGRNVVKTDINGVYKLKGWHKARFVTITNPTGYWTEKYYLEISNKVDKYDFALDKVETDNTNHTFLQVSDTEISGEVKDDGFGNWLNDVKNVIAEEKPAFLVHTGDICYVKGLNSHIKSMNTENMGIPVRYVIGNHDYVEGKYGEELFENIYGPVCYSFDVGNIHYIVSPLGYGDVPGKYSKSDIWRWVANDLANKDPNKKVVMFNHTYCPDETGFTVKYGGKELDFKENGLLAWVFGHWHYNYVNDVNGILNISTGRPDSGGIDQSPNAIRTVHITDNKIKETKLHYSNITGENEFKDYTWQTNIAGRGLYSDPIVVNDRVYVATMSDNYPAKCGLTCIDLKTGEIIWEYATVNSVRNSISYNNGKIVMQDVEGRVYCISEEGKLIWTTDCKLEGPVNTGQGVLVEGDYVYCGSPKQRYCLNLTNGEVKWKKEDNGNSSSPSRQVVYDDYLIIGSHWDSLNVYNKNTGKLLWKNKDARFITSTPFCYDNKVFLASSDSIIEMNIKNGKVLRTKKFENYNFDSASKPLISDGIGYFATANKGIVAINLTSFEEVWNFETRKSLIYTSPYSKGNVKTVDGSIVEKNGKLYFGASDGYIYCVDKLTGKLVEEINIGSPILNSLAFYGDKVVVSDFSGRVTLVEMTTLNSNLKD